MPRDEPIAFTDREIEIVKTFADQAVIAIENARLFDEVQARTKELAASLDDLRKAQDRLIQSEKLASLGQLTAGIAHEIKNPLNFVNNFSALSRELVGELADVVKAAPLDESPARRGGRADRARSTAISTRSCSTASAPTRSSRTCCSIRARARANERGTNVNAMVEEALNLAYHGARAEKPGFKVTIEKSLDPDAGDGRPLSAGDDPRAPELDFQRFLRDDQAQAGASGRRLMSRPSPHRPAISARASKSPFGTTAPGFPTR